MIEDGLASQIFFSKEAADYLEISVQRLNKLVQTGKITPLKKNSSGTIFHIAELEKRKQELAIFKEIGVKGESRMFKIDTPTKNEALNFSVLMNVLGYSERKLSPLFDKASTAFDTFRPIIDNVSEWAFFFKVPSDSLIEQYLVAKSEFEKLKASDEIIKLGDMNYPELLSRTEEAPRFLYLRGDRSLLHDSRTVALVGSRNASDEGRRNTERVVMMLGRNGIIIVSGLAKGIDVTAHATALEHGFKTIAVIGTNLNQYYPGENKDVQLAIEKKGLVVSQFSPATRTERWFFPLRNGVMSGISQATVIMEAGETSGALKQASFALKQKHLVLIPQNVCRLSSITWPEKLIKKGAIRVNTPKDIINELARHKVYKTNDGFEFNFENDLFNNMIVAEDEEKYVVSESGKD